MSALLSPVERLAADVRHLTARIPRVAEPISPPRRKGPEQRKPRVVKKAADLAKRLRDLDKVALNLRGKTERIEAELVDLRRELETLR